MPINSYKNYALSWRPVKERLTRPYYQSLVQQLEADILSGALQKNVKLPSQRELADYLDLNFTTIGQAYKHAMEKGLLYTNIGSGTFVSPNAFYSITISTNQVADHLIDLGLVSSFDMCNQRILPFIESVSKNAALNSLLNYRDPLGTHFQRATCRMASDTRRSDQCRRSCHCIWCPEWAGRDVSRRFFSRSADCRRSIHVFKFY